MPSFSQFKINPYAEQMGPRPRAGKAAAFALAGQMSKVILQIASISVLARLLSQEDFGVLAIGLLILTPCDILAGRAFSQAVIQAESLEEIKLNTLFWLCVGISTVFGLGVFGSGFAVQWATENSGAVMFFSLLAISLVLRGLSFIALGVVQRHMAFGYVACVELTAQTFGLGAAIIAALNDQGVTAFGWQYLISETIRSFLLLLKIDLRLRFTCSLRQTKSMLSFGLNLQGFEFLNYLRGNAAELIISTWVGATALGGFFNAKRLMFLPATQINLPVSSVALSSLSRLQGNPDKFVETWRRYLSMVTVVSIPLFIFIALNAKDVVLILLGPKWENVAPIMVALTPASFLASFNVATGWIYGPLGQTDRQLRWSTISTPINLIALLFAVKYGVLAVAWTMSLTGLFLLPISLAYCFSKSPVRFRDLSSVLRVPIVATLVACCALLAMTHLFDLSIFNVFYRFSAYLAAFAAVYAVCVIFTQFGQGVIRVLMSLADSRMKIAR